MKVCFPQVQLLEKENGSRKALPCCGESCSGNSHGMGIKMNKC